MDSFELNKVLGGLLGAAFIVFSISIVSDTIFAAPIPEKPGYVIEGGEEGGTGGGEQPAGPEPIGPLLANANPDAGMGTFKAKCATCHTAENGGANKAGPNLWNIVNRPTASHEGFAYSADMKKHAEAYKTWDYEHLSLFLTSPKGLVRGTAMAFVGIKKPQERADLIAYLRTLSDSPAPLPDPAAPAPAAENAAAPAEGAAAPAAGETAPATGGEAKPAN